MKNKFLLSATCFVSILSFNVLSMNGQASFDLETGAVGTGYNNVRIPGDQGTLFSLKDDLKSKTEIIFRIRVNYTIKSRHTLSLLYAPLETVSNGNLPYNILFEGVTFPANTDLSGTYKFNSYRLTYRYEIVLKPKFEFGLGFTAKIRDAKISLASSGLKSEKANVGFVPIINFRLLCKPSEKVGILLEGDALVAPQGRAEDVLIAATYRISDRLGLKAGYRILEGGADNDVVYNFALFNYASVGLFIYL
ncbi:MAG: hypothetical protein LLG13_07685 [Bacteroidales bacterium]|nr:hypothetical protein [Bacteroidales bacterium]